MRQYIEECLATSIEDRVEEFIKDYKHETACRRSTDAVTYSLGLNYLIKHAWSDIKDLIADAKVDGRFGKNPNKGPRKRSTT